MKELCAQPQTLSFWVKTASPYWLSMLETWDESCWSQILSSSSTNPYNILYRAAVMPPRTCSTQAFTSTHALTSAPAWSFCAHSYCKFLISASVTGWALSHACLVAGVDWPWAPEEICRCKHVVRLNIGMSTHACNPCELCTTKGNFGL
jgi:hypothetical protein